MSATLITFAERLAASFEEMRPVLVEHKKDNFGEVLPHVFMGDVARFALREFAETCNGPAHNRAKAELVLRSLFAFLETAYESEDPEIQELISVSFLENLPRPGEGDQSRIRDFAGPQMRAQLGVIG
jgi:hypothetical protein